MARKNIPKATKDELLIETIFKCSICENESTLEFHHIKFISQGGDNVKENLIILCPNCHSQVHKRKINAKLLNRIKEQWISRRFSGKEELRWADYLNERIDEIENDEDLKYYIDLKGKNENDVPSGKLSDSIDNFLVDAKNVLVILGDYGTGKTTFSKSIFCQKAEAYLNDPLKNRIPLLIYLKDYQKATGIGSLIEDYLRDFGLNYDSFRRIARKGQVLLILDGFDEMSGDMRKRISFQSFLEINKLYTKKIKLILTSRTHYFKERKDEIEVLHIEDLKNTGFKLKEIEDFNTYYYIMEFDEKDVEEYLKLYFGNKWKTFEDKMKKIYDLKDLSRRPILLNLIIQILPNINVTDGIITEEKLYDIFIDLWFKREIEEKKKDINKDSISLFIEELAFNMFNSRRSSIHHLEIEKNIMGYFGDKILSYIDLEDMGGKIRTNTFLIRDKDGNYFFVHKSFMEYFVSKRILREIRTGKASTLRTKYLPDEILKFVAKLMDQKDIEQLYAFMDTATNTLLPLNISTILGNTINHTFVLKKTGKLVTSGIESNKLNASLIYYYLSKGTSEVVPLKNVLKLIQEENKSVKLYSSLALGNIYNKHPKKFKRKVVDEKSLQHKIVVVGEAGSGKTTFIRQFVFKEFDDAYIATLGTKITRKGEVFLRPLDDNKFELLTGLLQFLTRNLCISFFVGC